MKVFLGGTCNESDWRSVLIDGLKMDYFNPVVDDWTQECMAKEIEERKNCDFCLYVITPKMTGVYSIAEAIDDSNKRPKKTIFCYKIHDHYDHFSEGQIHSLESVGNMVVANGGKWLPGVRHCREYLNNQL